MLGNNNDPPEQQKVFFFSYLSSRTNTLQKSKSKRTQQSSRISLDRSFQTTHKFLASSRSSLRGKTFHRAHRSKLILPCTHNIAIHFSLSRKQTNKQTNGFVVLVLCREIEITKDHHHHHRRNHHHEDCHLVPSLGRNSSVRIGHLDVYVDVVRRRCRQNLN